MGILIAAGIATAISALTIGGLLAWRSSRSERWLLLILVLVQIPASPLLFYCLRVPLEARLEHWVADANTRRIMALFYRPIFEELLKLWPLLIPSIWKSTTAGNRVWRALALGLGFGIGELWLLAQIVYRDDPVTANMEVWRLFGFINERVMVCLIHGALTAVALHQFGPGLPIAMGLHGLGNLPIYFQEISAFGLSAATWAVLVRAWVLWYFFAMCSLVWMMVGGDFHLIWLLFGDATCPFCGMVYPRATLTWSLRLIHHDHCPRCKARNNFSE